MCVGRTINSIENVITHGDLSSHDIRAISHIVAYASFLCWSHNTRLSDCEVTTPSFPMPEMLPPLISVYRADKIKVNVEHVMIYRVAHT